MVHSFRAVAALLTLAGLLAIAQPVMAQGVVVPAYPCPTVSYYYAPPVVSYYAPPVVSYYAPPAVSYYAPPAVSYYAAPSISYYGSPASFYAPAYYPPVAATTYYRYGPLGRRVWGTTSYYYGP